MSTQLFEDNAVSQMSGTLSQGGTTINLAAGTGERFPTPTDDDFFLATLYERSSASVEERVEIVKVLSRVADTLTVERDVGSKTGQSGGYSYPSAPSRTVYVELRWTAFAARNTMQASDNLATLVDPAAARANLGVIAENVPFTPAGGVLATNIQAAIEELGGRQASSAYLTNLANATRMADSFLYSTGADTVATTSLTSLARTLLGNTTPTAMRGTLGLGDSATRDVGTTAGTVASGDHTHTGYQATSAELTAIAGVNSTGLLRRTGTAAYSTLAITATGESVVTASTQAAARTAIGLGSVDNVSAASLRDRATHTGEQAQSTITGLVADLAGKAPTANPVFSGTPHLTGAAGSERLAAFETGGVLRWKAGASAIAEAGSNAGSNYAIYRYADAGAYIGMAMEISRATGNVVFSGTGQFAGLVSRGNLIIDPLSGNAAIELGSVGGIASAPLIDWHSSATANDYDFRMIASGGGATSGGGTLTLYGATFDLRNVLSTAVATADAGDIGFRIANTQYVRRLTANQSVVALTGDATLTAAQSEASSMTFTGTLTANAVVTVPAAQNNWSIYNATTGGFSITVRSTGAGMITVPAQGRRLLWTDGASVFAQDNYYETYVGLLSALDTVDKSSVIKAINEVNAKADSGGGSSPATLYFYSGF